MATRRTNPDNVLEETVTAAEEVPAKKTELEKAQAEIAALKAQLEAAQKPVQRGGKETDYDRVHRIEQETAEAGIDPWTVDIEVLVPHREKTEDPWYWINVNGLSVQIPANDRYQAMKLPWACVLVDLLKYEKASIDYQDSLEVFDPETNPHR